MPKFVVNGVEQLRYKDQSTVFMLTNSLPFYLAFNFPELIKYRLYYMAKHLYDFSENLDLSSAAFQHVPDYCKRISQVYQQLPSVEIWGSTTFYACIKQIDYLHQLGQLSFEDNLKLLEELEKLVNQSEQYADNGSKQEEEALSLTLSKPTYTLFLNEILNTDEYTLYSWQENELSHLFVYHAVSGVVSDFEKKVSIEKYVFLLRTTAIQISTINPKRRSDFFSKVKERIQRYREIFTSSSRQQPPISTLQSHSRKPHPIHKEDKQIH